MKISKIVFWCLFIVGIIISVIISRNTYEIIIDKERNILEIYTARLDSAIETNIKNVEMLDVLVQTNDGEIGRQDFDLFAATLYDDNTKGEIAYLPDGIVDYVYPYEGNEHIIGVNVFDETLTSVDAHKARETGNIVISGPFDLIMGGHGIVVRKPIYLNGEFFGFSSVSIELYNLLNFAGISNLDSLGYEYQLKTSYEGNEIVASQSDNFDQDKASYSMMEIGENNWQLGLYVSDRTYETVNEGLIWFLSILIINFIINTIIRRFEKTKTQMDLKLETDSLTGAYNRLKLQKYVKQTKDKGYALFYIDLNKFKPVNDNHGHDVGDKLLKAYTKRLVSNLKHDAIVARVGGDEFSIITPNVFEEQEAVAIKNRVEKISKRTFSIDGIDINISASVGHVLSNEAKDLDELFFIADKKMYEEKERYRNEDR